MIIASIILFIVAVSCIVIGAFMGKDEEDAPIGIGLKIIGAIVLVSSLALGSCATVKTVPSGTVYVLDLWGKIDKNPIYPGINVVNPFKNKTEFSTRTEVYVAGPAGNIESDANIYQDGQIVVLSKDGLPVDMDLTVWFKAMPGSTPGIYQKIGTDYVDKIVKPTTRSVARDALINYNATDLYQAGRVLLLKDIERVLKVEFRKRGILCENVQIRNITLPKMISEAIQNKLKAQQEAQKMEFQLLKEEKEADRKRIEAQGIKDSQEIIDKTLTEAYLSYYYIETLRSLVNSPNNTVMILPADQALTPMLNVNK